MAKCKLRFSFGQYKGKLITKAPASYMIELYDIRPIDKPSWLERHQPDIFKWLSDHIDELRGEDV